MRKIENFCDTRVKTGLKNEYLQYHEIEGSKKKIMTFCVGMTEHEQFEMVMSQSVLPATGCGETGSPKS